MADVEETLLDWVEGGAPTLVLTFGPAGGGRLLTQWLAGWLAARGVAATVVDRTAGVGEGEPERRDPDGRAVILAAGPSLAVGPSNGRLAADHGAVSVDADALDLAAVMTALLQDAGVDGAAAAELGPRFAPATRLADELADGSWTDPLAFVYQQSVVRRLAISMAGAPSGVLELGRVLLLLRPREIAISDEWLNIATRLSGRTCSVRDLSRLVLEWPWLLSFDLRDGERYVRPKNPLAVELLSGFVPPSGSEHFALYRALRARALDALVGRDSSDSFVAEQLPRQAMASFAFEDLFQDPGAVLCSDVTALVREIERDPELVLHPGAKSVLLCAHRLGSEVDRGSSLELAALRVGLTGFSVELGELLPNRPWRAEWSRAQPVNANRIIYSGRAPVLALSGSGQRSTAAVLGTSDGCAWLVEPYAAPRCVWDRRAEAGEVRDVGLFEAAGGERIAAVATSDQRVAAIDCRTHEELWQDHVTHVAPLSALAVSEGPADPLVASSGVDGAVRVSALRDGTPVGDSLVVYRHERSGQPVEIRGLRFAPLGGRLVLIFSAVDGRVGVVDPVAGRLLDVFSLGTVVISGLAAHPQGDGILLAVGSSDGRVSVAELTAAGDGVELGPVEQVAEHAGAVNRVCVTEADGKVRVLSASTDGTWRETTIGSEPETSSVEGHFGPVWDIGVIQAGDRQLAATAGSDGCCRVWVSEAVRRESLSLEKPTRHAGPVTTVALRVTADDATVWTGGADGDVRAWSILGATAGRSLAQESAAISALELAPPSEDGTVVLYSGTTRGELYRTEGIVHNPRRQSLLGIVHDGVTSLHVTGGDSSAMLVSGGRDGCVTAWDLGGDEPLESAQISKYGEVSAICSIEDADHMPIVVAGSQDGHLSFLDGTSFETLWRHPFGVPVVSLAAIPFHSAGLVAGLADGRVEFVRDARAGTDEWARLGSHTEEVTGVTSFVVGGRLVVATTGVDRMLRLWDLSTRTVLQQIQLDGEGLDVVAASPRVAVATTAGASVFSFSDDPLLLAARPQ